MTAPRVLVAGGVDPTGRAGIARDVAALESERVEPAVAVTALTVQDARRVHEVRPADVDVFRRSLDAAASLGDVAAVKVGLVPTPELADALCVFLEGVRAPVVVDPVLRASTGEDLTAQPSAQFLGRLLGKATVATPNLDELAALQGPSRTPEDRIRAAQRLRASGGPRAVLVKGGHGAESPVVDLLVTDHVETLTFPRLDLPRPTLGRGKGCELATRIAAGLAKGLDVREAVSAARRRVHERLKREAVAAVASATQEQDVDLYGRTLERLLARLEPGCIPEVGMNLAYAPQGVDDPRGVLGLAGRITIAGDSFAVAGRPLPGGPHHTGRIAATAQRLTGGTVWVLNHRHHPTMVPPEGNGHVAFRREEEPQSAASSMEWMTASAVGRLGRLPAYVSDAGMPGKEAMIRVFGSTPEELLARHEALHGRILDL